MPTLIRVDQNYEIPEQIPVVALRDLVFFPYMVLPLLIGRPKSLAALKDVESGDGYMLLLSQKDVQVEDPTWKDIYSVGTITKVLQISRIHDENTRVVLEGIGRVRVDKFLSSEPNLKALIEPFVLEERETHKESKKSEALVRSVVRLFNQYVQLSDLLPDELLGSISMEGDRIRMAHMISGHILIPPNEKQELLEVPNVTTYFELLKEILIRELEILRIEDNLDAQIQMQMDSDHRQLYLQAQLKAIQEELGSNSSDEWSDLSTKIVSTTLPQHVQERAERDIRQLKKMNPVSPEASVIRTYLDWILGLPWTERREDNLDVEHAAEILDQAHHGLDEVKERILDHIAVLSLVGELKGPILCLVGPPGVGKTSLGHSIAEALGREFIRVSLGGIRDEAEIRGHRRTYVGALPGRIIQGMQRSGTVNPVFLLDEVDKLANDFHGDPSAALLEVLDPEQNRNFTDHYLELEYDLSDVFFVATANTLAGIPSPLRDRMEIIRLPGYLDTEKLTIGLRFIWPHQARRHGLNPEEISLTKEAIKEIILRFTREAGVRELDRRISRVARKLARKKSYRNEVIDQPMEICAGDLKELLGPPRYLARTKEGEDKRYGIANGLAWTEAGGEVLDVEVAVIPGSGQIQLTGTLGDIMKESAFAAVTYTRSRAARLGLNPKFHKDIDIHIHIPEGATPKDGPSAGITIATALISALTGSFSHSDVAMTGEITLRGRVLPVGGIKEKVVAALREGLQKVILPSGNLAELETLPDEILNSMEFVAVKTMDEVLIEALSPLPEFSIGVIASEVAMRTQLSQ